MTNKTMKRAIVGLIIAIINMFKVLTGFDVCVGDEFIYAIVDFAFVIWVGYKNNDFSDVSAKFTKIMRRVKKLVKTGDMSLLDAIDNTVTEWEKEHDNH